MPILRLLTGYVKNYQSEKKALYLLCLMMLFWAIYEGTISYMTPLMIVNNGISESIMGIIIGTSSIAGALFDFVACRIFKNTYYKRMFLIMFSICLVYPLILSQAHSFVIYILAMSLWGIYFDLKNIGNFDFVGRHTAKTEHTSSFGLIQVFQSIGFLLAPILVGLLIADSFNYKPLILAWVFLIMGLIFFIFLYISKNQDKPYEEATNNPKQKTWGRFIIRLERFRQNIISSFNFNFND
jgi:predicted MFS family arabinose efflux permease